MDQFAVQQYLASFVSEHGYFNNLGDSSATTFGCSAAVILASALSGTKSADELAAMTLLPINFVGAVIFITESLGIWDTHNAKLLLMSAVHSPHDYARIEGDLTAVAEQIWSGRAGDAIVNRDIVLERLRAGRVVGGSLEGFTDPESQASYLVQFRTICDE